MDDIENQDGEANSTHQKVLNKFNLDKLWGSKDRFSSKR